MIVRHNKLRTFSQRLHHLTTAGWLMLSLTLVASCGQSIFASLDEMSVEDQIIAHLEADEPDKALSLIDKELEKTPDDNKLKSIKSAAIAQKYGVDTMSLALAVIEQQNSGTAGEQSALSTLLNVLPPVDDVAIAGVQQAVDILNSIGIELRLNSDNFKLTMLNMALLSMRLKLIDGDGTGTFTADELQNLSTEQAAAILDTLGGAVNAADAAAQAGVSTEVAAKAIQDVKDQIDSQPGANQDEKLRNFLEQLKASSP